MEALEFEVNADVDAIIGGRTGKACLHTGIQTDMARRKILRGEKQINWVGFPVY